MADKVDGGDPPQGWYPDPEDVSYLRRWDGAAWTDERVPASRGRRRLRSHTPVGAAGAAPADGAGRGPERPGPEGPGPEGPGPDGGAPDGASAEAHEHTSPPAPGLGDLEAQLRRRQAEIDRLVERERGLAGAVERRRAEIAEIAEREEALVQRLRQARESLARVEQQTADADAVEARLAELAAAEAATAQELDRRRTELGELVRETAELRDRASTERVEALRVAEAERAEALRVAEAERAEARQLVESERAERERLRTAVEQLREDHAAAAAEADATARLLEDQTRRREELTREHDELTREHEELTREHDELVRRHDGVVAEHEELTRLHEELTRQHEELADRLEERRAELAEAGTRLEATRAKLVDLGERVAVQDLGLYDYKHPAEDSVVLAAQLTALREAIVRTLRAGEAITAPASFKLGHSAAKGQQVVAEVSALSLRAYNAEAENAVRTAGPGGIDAAITRLIRARDAVARHGAWLGVAITDGYHELRTQEIEMAGEYKIRKEREAAAPAFGTPGGVPGGYVAGGAPREYVPGAGHGTSGPGHVPGAPGRPDAGQAPGPSYGTWGSPNPAAPVSSNGRSGR